MDVKNNHLSELLLMADASQIGPTNFLFTQILTNSFIDLEFRNKALRMMARSVDPAKMKKDNVEELIAQARLILWILGPIWLASGKVLPRVSGQNWLAWLQNEPRVDLIKYYKQFGQYNPLWQETVDDSLIAIKQELSKYVVVKVTRIFLERLPRPMINS